MHRCRISRVDQLYADYFLVVFFFVSWIGFPFAYYGWREECMGNWAWCSEGLVMTILPRFYL